MTQMPQLPPMGWYPDPADPASERYWDGAAWTHNTKPAEQQPTSWPTVPGTQTPGSLPQQAQPQPGSPAYGQNLYAQQPPPQNSYGQHPYAQPYPSGQYPYGSRGVQPAYGRVATTEDGVPLAGWWLRVLAYVLDMTLVGLISVAVGWPYVRRIMDAYRLFLDDYIAAAEASAAGGISSLPVLTGYDIVNPTSGFQLVQVLVLLVYLLLCYGLLSGTLFQRALGMRVVPVNRGQEPRLAWGQSAARAMIFALVTAIPLLPYVSYLMPLWTSKKQTLHDLVAATQVVKRR